MTEPRWHTDPMSEPQSREQIIEQAADAMDAERVTIGSGFYATDVPYGTCLTLAERAVPVITKAATDRMRALAADWAEFMKDPELSDKGRAGVRLCAAELRRLCDAIDAEMGVGR